MLTYQGNTWQAQHLKVPMRIREEGREERSAPVLVAVAIEADAQSSTPRSLMCFQVSDSSCSFAVQCLVSVRIVRLR